MKETIQKQLSLSSALLQVILGLLVMAAGLLVLLCDIEFYNSLFYIPAWYGYLIIIDAAIYFKTDQGQSFLRGKRKELYAMLFWSAPFWFFFEAYNFDLKNWYYVLAPRGFWIQFAVSWISFATVLPACFFHAELLKAYGVFKGRTSPPLSITGSLLASLSVFGFLCLLLPVLLPRYCFWMVWGALLGLPLVINYRAKCPSLLADLEHGQPKRTYRLLLSGFWIGFLWESLNFWARCKWIYTVPGLEDWKLFEMPLLGFLGFPVLSLSAFSFYSMWCHYVRGGAHWEEEGKGKDVSWDGRKQLSMPLQASIKVLAVLFTVLVVLASDDLSVRSYRLRLQDIISMDDGSLKQLAALEIRTPEQLLSRVDRSSFKNFSQQSGLAEQKLKTFYLFSALSLHKGMGSKNASLLWHRRIKSQGQLVGRDAERLYLELRNIAREKNIRAPERAEIKVWIRAARI